MSHGLETAINNGMIITKDDNTPTLNNHQVVASVNTPIQNSFLLSIFLIFFLNFTWSVNISHVTIHTCFCIIIIKHIIYSRVFTILRSITIKFFCIYFYHIQPPPIAPEHSSPCKKNLLGISHSCAR